MEIETGAERYERLNELSCHEVDKLELARASALFVKRVVFRQINPTAIAFLSTLSDMISGKSDIASLEIMGFRAKLLLSAKAVEVVFGDFGSEMIKTADKINKEYIDICEGDKIYPNSDQNEGESVKVGPFDGVAEFMGKGEGNVVSLNNGEDHKESREAFLEYYTPRITVAAEKTVNDIINYIKNNADKRTGEFKLTFEVLSKLRMASTLHEINPYFEMKDDEFEVFVHDYNKQMLRMANDAFVRVIKNLDFKGMPKWILDKITNLDSFKPDPDFFDKYIGTIYDQAIENMPQNPDEYGYIHHLISKKFSRDRVISEVSAIFPAASNTTSSAIQIVSELWAQYPEAFEQAKKVKYGVSSLATECITHQAVLEAFPRVAEKSIGNGILKGDFIAAMSGTILRNASKKFTWNRVLQARKPNQRESLLSLNQILSVAFGAPPTTQEDIENNRHCAGKPIALKTIKLFIEKIIENNISIVGYKKGCLTMGAENDPGGVVTFKVNKEVVANFDLEQ